MKVLILISSVDQVPTRYRSSLLVVTQSNWQEISHYLEGKTDPIHMFLHENCPAERLLKVFEEYQGNLAVYTTSLLDTVLLSRFTNVLNRRKIEIKKDFGFPSEIEKQFSTLRSSL